ncbi:hypothetical protein ACTBNQ_001375 [Listeria monocytogenes]|nr:hypothetical protein [Listeria monocytogenes]EAC3953009.1 hypothetical protein [Listeria monocytogenes]EAC9555218.1 hypothetical protein [Listeria monocytogenes]EAD0532558.1 hypothetical protein [Listeria monocytogenes]EAE1964014.1 hypothetical protein [Listeria monocytogenes]
MKYSFELQTDIAIEKIWPLYEDVNKWFKWEDDLEDISLHGEFITGSNGSMKLSGQPSMDFVLVSVKAGKSFTDRTSIPNVGDIYFIHELNDNEGKTLVRHSVEFIPANRKANLKDLEFVSQIFADVPASIFSLIEAANE